MKTSESTVVEAIVTDEVETLADLDATDERGVSADLVRAYLNGIGRTRLLTAVEEVTLSKRIEAGLYAEEKLPSAPADLAPLLRGSSSPRARPRRTTCWRRTSAWWSASRSGTRGGAWRSST
ncbi:hypothetical protein BJ964_000726 [Actinoplanes lobatus]|nr:hypothetical protein [Actinoplanes lobatus]